MESVGFKAKPAIVIEDLPTSTVWRENRLGVSLISQKDGKPKLY